MIICLCNHVSDSDIKGLFDKGARSVSDIQAVSRAGTACGTCVLAIERCLRQQVAQIKKAEQETDKDEDTDSREKLPSAS